ncbi:MAG: succinate dehydrogenase [Rhodospirillaceae bacterium]
MIPGDVTGNPQTEARLWLAQRVSAAVLAACIVVHLATIIVATQGGLTAAEIAGRVGGSAAWFAFYLVFVAAVTVHAPIGLRAVLNEMTGLSRGRVDLLCFIAAVFIGYRGFRVAWKFYDMGGAS